MSDYNGLRTGVIGVGSMGQNHARIYSQESNLIGVSDLDNQIGKDVAQRFNTKYFNNLDELLSKADAVSVSVPTEFHSQVAIKCIENGTHILLEKPMASNAEEAKKLIQLAKNAGVVLAVGHIERHNPVIKYAKECMNSKEWGNLITMSSKRWSNYPERIHDVGVVMDLAIHDIDIMNYLASSEVVNVKSVKGFKENLKYEDNAAILLEYANKVNGICEVNWLTPVKIREITLTFDKAFVVIDYIQQTLRITKRLSYSIDKKNLFLSSEELDQDFVEITKQEPLRLEILDFLESIKSKREPLVTGKDGLRALEIAMRVLE